MSDAERPTGLIFNRRPDVRILWDAKEREFDVYFEIEEENCDCFTGAYMGSAPTIKQACELAAGVYDEVEVAPVRAS